MAITIELSAEAEAALRRRAEEKGVTASEYFEGLVVEPSDEKDTSRENLEGRYETLMKIAAKWHALPTLDHRTPDQIIGYDDYGLPTP